MGTGSKIKELREKANMTQEELGKLLGVKKSAINKYEKGVVVNYKRTTIEKMCAIFNVTPQELMQIDRLDGNVNELLKNNDLNPNTISTLNMAKDMYNNPELNNLIRACAELGDEDLESLMLLLKQYRQLTKQKKKDIGQILRIFLEEEENSL